jgi:invasion protein IalB
MRRVGKARNWRHEKTGDPLYFAANMVQKPGPPLYIAEMPLPPRMVASLRAGNTLAILVGSADTGQTIRFELSLEGVSAALDRFSEM